MQTTLCFSCVIDIDSGSLIIRFMAMAVLLFYLEFSSGESLFDKWQPVFCVIRNGAVLAFPVLTITTE